ncbi:hypothetical protein DUI87_30417 [Hirundo rustica rustica]|uniref:ribonuclease H n=1 Tax=Hirundo rustica rustica TaxID=333673 RepID=A0A3M0IWC3_HIRRU|nr:hypothetical protein DUI87_30417 [Hirundo rustica rustica]
MYHPEEPIVNFEVGPHHEEFEFLVDTGADRSSVNKLPVGVTIGGRTCEVMGAEGKPFTAPIIEKIEIRGNSKLVIADFIYLPDLDNNLLGRDLQVQLGVGVIPEGGRMRVKIMKLTAEDLNKIHPEVWAEGGKTGLLNITPIKVEMQPGISPIRVKQYPISSEGKRGLATIIEQLLKENILEPCMSPHNTPILAVKKAEGKYRLVQDLREINKVTITRHPVVPNPYTLLSQIPCEHAWFTIIDLKDAFWACPLAEESRDWFAFEWEHPETRRRQQLRWTRLPQGFTESPNLFGQALEGLLEQFRPSGQVQILQYVDDLLISGENEIEYEITLMNTENLSLVTSKNLNPAQFLSGEPLQELEHDCLELMNYQTKVREDLENTPLPYGRKLFTDGSSRVLEGKRVSGYAIVEGLTEESIKILEKGKLPSSWSAQLCEIYAVKRGLDLLEGDRGTIYTDSRYAYGIIHTFGKIWEERGYLNSKGKDLAHKEMIKSVLTSLLKPIEIAVVHVKGHQKGNTFEGRGNQIADQEAKQAALNPKEPVKALTLSAAPEGEEKQGEPKYDKTELKLIEELNMRRGEHGEWITSDGEVWTPEKIINTYGPATWAQDGSWGYRTPIYMLNRIIRLQAVLEVISNNTALALDHISYQLAQTRAIVYQIRLAVDYLLADEGGICGKFNSSECCLEIDDKSEVIRNISKEIRKVAYVGNQEWTPLVNLDWWDNFWSLKGAWWKKVGMIALCAIASLLFIPCMLPCLIRVITTAVQASLQVSEINIKEPNNSNRPTRILKLTSNQKEPSMAEQIYHQYQELKEVYCNEPKLMRAKARSKKKRGD